jgi:hypothetical protein
MQRYRLDPEKPPQLTPDEARRLAETPIDYSDIPPLGDKFFRKAEAEKPPALDAEEIARRREASHQAQACNRIEGIPHDPATDPIFEALILGEIDFEQAIARIKALPRRA